MTTDPELVPAEQVSAWLGDLPRPVAITGGTGFVGSHLVDTLTGAGVQPRVLMRDPRTPRWIRGRSVEAVRGDLGDPGALTRLVAGAATVIHMAGLVRAGREAAFDNVNRAGTERLLEAVRAAAPEARLVHVSSLAAAGPSASPEGVRPDDPPRPVSAYGRSKLAAERAVVAGLPPERWTVIRPPAIYGPRDTDVLAFFRMASSGLAAVPSGERWISVVFVADVVRAVLSAAARRGSGAVLHVAEPRPYRLDELLRLIAETGGCRARLLRVPPPLVLTAGAGGSLLHALGLRRLPLTLDKTREMLARHWAMHCTASLETLQMPDPVDFPTGCARTWSWYRTQGWLP